MKNKKFLNVLVFYLAPFERVLSNFIYNLNFLIAVAGTASGVSS